jgi:hypothetical protein
MKVGKARRQAQIMPMYSSKILSHWSTKRLQRSGTQVHMDSRVYGQRGESPCIICTLEKSRRLGKPNCAHSNNAAKTIVSVIEGKRIGETYTIPRLNNAITFNFLDSLMFKFQITGRGKQTTRISLAILNAPELYARLPAGKQFPGTAGSQCFLTGMQSKLLAVRSAVYPAEITKALP